MRVNTKGGVPPCDRRLDRRKVAIAAVAALFLFATASSAKADTKFDIVPGLSFMTLGQDIDLTPLGLGVVSIQGQGGPSGLTADLYGQVRAIIDPGTGTISFPGGSAIVPADKAFYAPHDPVTSDPTFPPVGTTFGAYGLAEPTILGLAQVEYDLQGDLFGAPRPLSGGTSGTFDIDFASFGDIILGTAGRIAFASVLGGDTGDVIGDPLAVLDALGGGLDGSWDPLDLTAGPLGTLTIPIQSVFSTQITGDQLPPGGITVFFYATGNIVATPAVPEPSSIFLLGLGTVGLLTYGWRLRKRRS